MAVSGFNSTVAARTRAAKEIVDTSDLLSKYLDLGGLKRDLEAIVSAGLDAEAANLGQSQAKAAGKGATVDVLVTFASVQKEYSAVMGVVQAVQADLARSGGSAELTVRLDGILTNEAELSVKVYETEAGTKRKASRSASQEALRAEIAKDAAALLDLTDVHPFLTERRVDSARLEGLKKSAEDLSGLLADRAAAKGAAKTSSKEERDAVSRQRDVWGACYRLLHALSDKDERVRSLLAQAKR
jgi:hypothetical protein